MDGIGASPLTLPLSITTKGEINAEAEVSFLTPEHFVNSLPMYNGVDTIA